MAQKLDLDELICKLLNVGSPGCSLTKTVKEQEIMHLCLLAKEISFDYNLLRLFDRGGFPPFVNYLFFGDYVDREIQNLETISLLLCYKIKYSENFFLLRGNHECSVINRVYGFFEECNYRYQSEVFNAMPFTGLVAGKMPLYVWWSITTTEKYRSASTDYSTYRSFKSIYSHRFVVVSIP
ncbi:unnamed protein product [Wuchereria bancrofti]|uniref:Serine/threonine-protein phosphatase n=1 Tax=Wuchereria bancrofti TaxID=6293 RepID=A0A3P7DW58_WUCBA|nr:unnamed protein product [Wuchereria bancrofti]